jgi:hypothetical protein
LKAAQDVEQAAKVTVFDANKALLDSKIDLHKAAVATFRDDTLKQAAATVATTTLDSPHAMDTTPFTATTKESMVAAAAALDVVNQHQVITKDKADLATVDYKIPVPAKDLSDEIKFSHARLNG